MTRAKRTLTYGSLAIIFLLSIYFEGISQHSPSEPKQISLFNTSMNAQVSCYRIPAIITAPNGDIIAAIDERVPSCRDLKWSDDINIVMRKSTDNGYSWSEIKRLVDYPLGQSASDPSMILDEVTGEIFLFYNYMDIIKEKDIYYLKVISSKDNGQTWSSPIDITSQISKPEWSNDFKFITSGRGIQTSDGTLVHTMVNIQNGAHLFKSDDHGASWNLINTPLKPGDESKIVQLSDGRWMVNSRVNKMGARFVHISDDKGKSWSSYPDNQLIDPACNASILRYTHVNEDEHDLLLFTNASSTNQRENLVIKVSKDDGQSWNSGRTIYSGKAAYSEMTILKNGGVGVFYEKDGYKDNVFVRLSLDWIIKGDSE